MTNLVASRSALMTAVTLAMVVACGGSTSDVTNADGGGSSDGSANDGASSDGASSDGGGSNDGASSDSSSGDASSGDSSSDGGGGVPINHRPDDSQCSTSPAAGTCTIMGPGACMHDSDCTTGTNGRCIEGTHGAITCFCSYDACTHDSDCGAGKLCVCHGSAYTSGAGNTCTDGNCRVDADCGAGKYCSPSHGTSGCGGVTGYYCHVASDECTNDSDCMGGAKVCAWSATASHWKCQQELLCP